MTSTYYVKWFDGRPQVEADPDSKRKALIVKLYKNKQMAKRFSNVKVKKVTLVME